MVVVSQIRACTENVRNQPILSPVTVLILDIKETDAKVCIANVDLTTAVRFSIVLAGLTNSITHCPSVRYILLTTRSRVAAVIENI